MLKLKNIVQRFSEVEFKHFTNGLHENKAGKSFRLLELLRSNNLNDNEILSQLDVNQGAYYTLKSRLFEKVQEFLINNLEGPKIDLLKKVANIPTMVHDTNKVTAIAILTKLEKDLLDYDMPFELMSVYQALKKIHFYSPKYYDYAQLYNKQMAYTVALDKVEDLVSDFNRKLGAYYQSRDDGILEYLLLIRKEVGNVSQLYDSHHLYVYRSLLSAMCFLFFPKDQYHLDDDEPVEDLLESVSKIFDKYRTDNNYRYLDLVFCFIGFEYYHKLGIHKKENEYFEKVQEQLPTLLLCNFSTFPTKFLISKIERYCKINAENQLYHENKELVDIYLPDKNDVPNYINYMIYLAVSCYYAKHYQEAIDILNNLRNDVSFKEYGHSEIEVKLLLALFYSMTNEYNLATNLLRNTERKIKELKNSNYENANVFIKLLKIPMKLNTANVEEKLNKLKDQFLMLNGGHTKLLTFLKVDSDFISKIAQTIKA